MTKVTAIICPKCDDVIFSRARHDFRSCGCDSVSVDGGFDYIKTSYNPELSVVFLELKLPYTKQQIYDDWNKSIDKLGKHKYNDIEEYL